jgi:DNA end-binding protein Ku
MYTATREHEMSFHQFEKDSSDRIRYKRVNERTGREVDFDHIVKGADVGEDNYVMLDADELDSVAPGRSRSLEISRFVDLDEIDPIYYHRTYYLGPGSEDTAKVYGLLRDAMAGENKAAIGTLVMRGKEYLTAIRAEDDVLMLQTMFFADEVRRPKDEIDSLPQRGTAKKAELAMAHQLIDSMSGSWKPSDYHDSYTERVQKLIEAKKKGRKVTVAEAAPEPTGVNDLLEVLRRSVEEASQRRGSKSATKTTAQKTTAQKTTAKKTPAQKTPAKEATKSTAAKSTAKKPTKPRKATKKAA